MNGVSFEVKLMFVLYMFHTNNSENVSQQAQNKRHKTDMGHLIELSLCFMLFPLKCFCLLDQVTDCVTLTILGCAAFRLFNKV